MNKCYYYRFFSPIGEIFVASTAKGICRVNLPGETDEFFYWLDLNYPVNEESCNENLVVINQLQEYFSGQRHQFDLTLDLQGTDFQKQVWLEVKSIPYGKTSSYGAIALALGKPGAARAVGQALKNNNLPVIIPCHRVINSDGTLGGFNGDLGLKEKMLSLEKFFMREQR